MAKSSPDSKPQQFVICIQNDAYPASLERGKVYPVAPDSQAPKQQMVRDIDESGEEYLYPQKYFVEIHLPNAAD